MPATYEPIATTTLGSSAASVTFSSVSGTYTDLVLVINGSASAIDTCGIRFNSDSGTNYSLTYLNGNGSSASSGRVTSLTYVGAGEVATSNSTIVTQINNYSNTTTNKTVLSRANTPNNFVQALVSLWRNTSAITSVTVLMNSGTFNSGSTFTLYGIKAA